MSDSRPWLAVYPEGVPANINAEQYSSLVDYVEQTCNKYKKKTAFSLMGKELSFTEVDTMSTQFGAYLHSRGLEPGDRFALMMPNLLQYPIALFGALKAGLIIVNTNPLYTPREMEHQFTDSEVKGILIAENFAANLEKILPTTNIKVIITTSIGEMLGGLKGGFVDFAVKNLKRAIPKFDISNTVRFKEALVQGKKFTLPKFDKNPDDVVVHQYTGGTTGVSKGAMLTNKNLVANMLQMKEFIEPYMNSDKDPIVLAPLPLYHIFAFTVNCLGVMDMGGHSVLIVNPKDLSTIVKEFKRYKITGLTGVNTLYNALANNSDFQSLDLSDLDFAAAGGTALQKAVADKWIEETKCEISEGYGMTEASPVVTTNPKGQIRLGTVGIPVPSTELKIVNDEGQAVTSGERGEVWVKGPQVMKGYYNRPEETANTITTDGWLRTGDVGILEQDGYLRIVDRLKDMILVSGFNVYPNEIEDVVALHPKVDEVAAIGIPSEKSGECVKIFVTKKDKSLNEDELIKHCRENLTGYKVPKDVAFVKELPKSNVGKILRRKLRDEA